MKAYCNNHHKLKKIHHDFLGTALIDVQSVVRLAILPAWSITHRNFSQIAFAEVDTHLKLTLTVFQTLIALLLLTFLLLNFSVIFQIDVWRHDAVYNSADYFYKLMTEGRWINYVLWEVLRLINPHVSLIVIYLSLSYFSFTSAYRVVDSKRYALIISLLILQIPYLSYLSGWPTTLLPAFVALGLATYLSDKMPTKWFMFIFASIFFGTSSNLFFLMPLLFISNLSFRKFHQILFLWMVAFVFGYLVAQSVTFLFTFEFMRLADWRQPHYIGNVNDLMINIMTSFASFFAHSKQIIAISNFTLVTIAVLLALVFTNTRTRLNSMLLCFIAGIAIYVTVIPVGIYVSPRTAATYWICLVFMVTVRDKMADMEKLLTLTLVLMIGWNMAQASNQALHWYSGITTTLKDEMRQALPVSDPQATEILISMPDDQIKDLVKIIEKQLNLTYITGEGFGEAKRMAPVLKALGYKNIRVCPGCSPLYDQINNTNEIGSSDMFKAKFATQGKIVLFIDKEFID